MSVHDAKGVICQIDNRTGAESSARQVVGGGIDSTVAVAAVPETYADMNFLLRLQDKAPQLNI